MFKTIALAAATAAAFLPGTVGAQWAPQGGRTDYAAFDASQAASPVDRLVLCDLTGFLQSRPDLNHDRVWARRDDWRWEPVLHPRFGLAGKWYDPTFGRAYKRYEQAGLTNRRQLADSQTRLSPAMIRQFETLGPGDARFLNAQAQYCRTVAVTQARYLR